jgi:sulfur carrier protein
MLNVTVNATEHQLPDQTVLQQLLEQLAVGSGRIAVEINGEIVPRSQFATFQLADGDKIEIVQAIGGG